MERHNASLLITEFLRSRDPQIRLNAITALASLESVEGFKEIIQTAIADDDPKVRDRAEQEILAVQGPAAEPVARALFDELRPGANQLAAYGLIGRLRSRGMAIGFPRLSVLRRLKLAFAFRTGSREKPFSDLRKSTVLGGLIGGVALLLYASLAMRVTLASPGAVAVALSGIVLPFLILFVFRSWWRPVQRQPDRFCAVFIEALLLALAGALTGLLVVAIDLLNRSAVATGTSVAICACSSALSLSAVRLGTVLGHAAVPGALANRLCQILTGFATGVWVLTLISAAIGWATDPATAANWIVMVPVLFGVAVALSQIDYSEYIRHRPRRAVRPAALLMSALLVLSLGAVLAVPLIPKRFARQSDRTVAGKRIISFAELPQWIDFTLDQPRIVFLNVPEEAQNFGHFKIALRPGSKPKLPPPDPGKQMESEIESAKSGFIDFADDPPVIEEYLAPGTTSLCKAAQVPTG